MLLQHILVYSDLDREHIRINVQKLKKIVSSAHVDLYILKVKELRAVFYCLFIIGRKKLPRHLRLVLLTSSRGAGVSG